MENILLEIAGFLATTLVFIFLVKLFAGWLENNK